MNKSFVEVEVIKGALSKDYLNAVAKLRIEVFRAFPYLYDGDLEYERRYLKKYSSTDGAVLVLALSGEQVVGASTGLPMIYESDEVKSPLVRAGIDVARVFYFGESILLPEYRGQGIGHTFFDKREEHARRLPFIDMTCFCAVDRPADHPLKPNDYRPLDTFWTKRGYNKQKNLQAYFSWKDINDHEETNKPLTFWTKSIAKNG